MFLGILLFLVSMTLSLSAQADQQYVSSAYLAPAQVNNEYGSSAKAPSKQSVIINQAANNQNPVTTNQHTTTAFTQYPYSAEAKRTWFEHCLKVKNNPQVSQYIQDYCACGWHGIIHNIPPALFTATEPAIIKKRNILLKVIVQDCYVKILSVQREQQKH